MYIKENYLKETIIPISFCFSFILVVCFICECLLLCLKKKTKLLLFFEKKTKFEFKIFHLHFYYKIIFACCLLFIIYHRELYTSSHLVYAVCSVFVIIYFKQKDYSKAQINSSLKDTEGIGALWAYQTYYAYYERILKNIMERMKNFEEEHNIQFYSKKLLIIIPLSCNIEGTFTEKDPSIEKFDLLDIVEDDAGWNYNRIFKNPVFKISSYKDVSESTYIVAEFSQPVSALWRSRYILKEEKFAYIRNCYVKTLKSLLHGSPCIIVLHDDENGSETLSGCILSAIEKERQIFTA